MFGGKKTALTQTVAVEREFRCKRCGFTSDVKVLGVGQSLDDNDYFLDYELAEQRANQSASNEAMKNADLTVKICPCPRCGARDGSRFITESALTMLAAALFVCGIPLLINALEGGSNAVMAWLTVALGLAILTGYFFKTVRWRWITAEKRVFFSKAPETEDDAPKPKRVKKAAKLKRARAESPRDEA